MSPSLVTSARVSYANRLVRRYPMSLHILPLSTRRHVVRTVHRRPVISVPNRRPVLSSFADCGPHMNLPSSIQPIPYSVYTKLTSSGVLVRLLVNFHRPCMTPHYPTVDVIIVRFHPNDKVSVVPFDWHAAWPIRRTFQDILHIRTLSLHIPLVLVFFSKAPKEG